MKLFLLTRKDEPRGWDFYQAAIVAAETASLARKIHPRGIGAEPDDSWPESSMVSATYIGEAKPKTKTGVILTDFFAG
jgi:hypothetical protein